jgi:hypothetical protein
MTLEELFGNATTTNQLNILRHTIQHIDGNITIKECIEYIDTRIAEIMKYQNETLPVLLAEHAAKYEGKYFMVQHQDSSAKQDCKLTTVLHITKAIGELRYGEIDVLIWGEELYRYNNDFKVKSLLGSDKLSSSHDYITNFDNGKSDNLVEITEEEYNQRKQLFQQLETLFPFSETKDSE